MSIILACYVDTYICFFTSQSGIASFVSTWLLNPLVQSVQHTFLLTFFFLFLFFFPPHFQNRFLGCLFSLTDKISGRNNVSAEILSGVVTEQTSTEQNGTKTDNTGLETNAKDMSTAESGNIKYSKYAKG